MASQQEIEDANSPLVTSITEMIAYLPPISPDICIYRAPQRVRQLNEKAYTPRKVSIGPLHHGKEHLLPMEEQKLRLCLDINEYCRTHRIPWHRWKDILKRDYCSTPWRVVSTVAAVVLLMLTLIQTICSVISISQKK